MLIKASYQTLQAHMAVPGRNPCHIPYWDKLPKDDKEKHNKFVEIIWAESGVRRFLKLLGTRGFRAWREYLAEKAKGE